jgi:hypothetical protein
VKTEALGELSEEELGLGLLCFAAGQATRGSRCGKRGLGQEGVRPHAHAEAAGRGRAYPARGGRGRGGDCPCVSLPLQLRALGVCSQEASVLSSYKYSHSCSFHLEV